MSYAQNAYKIENLKSNHYILFYSYIFIRKDTFDCILCNSSHRIEKIKKKYTEGDDECIIL
jgi:hypothetical protein